MVLKKLKFIVPAGYAERFLPQLANVLTNLLETLTGWDDENLGLALCDLMDEKKPFGCVMEMVKFGDFEVTFTFADTPKGRGQESLERDMSCFYATLVQ
jgi:hypothetical protein